MGHVNTLAEPVGSGSGNRRPGGSRERPANPCGVDALTGKQSLAYDQRLDVFKALADPTRRTILDELTDRDGQTLFELCSRLLMKHGIDSSRQAISQHLDVLEAAGLVRVKRDGRYKFHYLDSAPLKEITDRWPIQD
jgi:DNA-binding transcriptional ArsR family regulator